MGTLAENDRLTDSVTATAGQTDFPADFPLLRDQAGDPTGVFMRRVRGGVETILDLDDFTVPAEADGGFTCRLAVAALAGDEYQVFGRYPALRERAHTVGGATRTPTLEGDAVQFAATLQEQARDIGRSVAAPLGEAGHALPARASLKGKLLYGDQASGDLTPLSEAGAAALFKGDPGGNVDSVGVFAAVQGMSIPPATGVIRPSDRGQAPLVDATGETLDPAGEGVWWTTSDSGARQWKYDGDLSFARNFGAGAAASAAANLAAFTYLFGTATRGKIELDREVYDIGNATLTFGVANVHVKGVRGGTRIRSAAKVILDMASTASDVVFENIIFESYSTDNGFGAGATSWSISALVRWLHTLGVRITFLRCGFTAPLAKVSAVKAIGDIAGEGTESIHFYECWVENIGLMAFEVSCYPTTIGQPQSTTPRHVDWVWDDVLIKDTAQQDTMYGQGISVGGHVSDFKGRNIKFDNVLYAALELFGHNLDFVDCSSKGLTRQRTVQVGHVAAGDPTIGTHPDNSVIALTANPQVQAGYPDIDAIRATRWANNSIRDFKCLDQHQGYVRFWYNKNLRTSGNLFNVDKWVSYAGASKAISVGDSYVCAGTYGLYCSNEAQHGAQTDDCLWDALDIDHSPAAAGVSLIRNIGASTARNRVRGLTYTPSATSIRLIDATGGATACYVKDAKTHAGASYLKQFRGLSADADFDLSAQDSAPSTCSADAIEITSSVPLTASRTVTFPLGMSGLKRVKNATTGGQAVVAAQAGGGATVSIANGATTVLAFSGVAGGGVAAA